MKCQRLLVILITMSFVKNEKGQMAIFIALFFQVIFVFFAMAINMGLVIHDKINLQNAVDIAAYYGAAKQAEVLNQIGHINYQMRQNYKLFVWRYRVLGTLGNKNHPLMYLQWNVGNRALRPDEPSWDPDSPSPAEVLPTVCVAHSVFRETVELDPDAASVCRENYSDLPAVDPPSPPGGAVPGSSNLPAAFEFLQNQLNKFCLEAGVFNWLYSTRILAHFRVDGLVRKNMIWRLAQNLSRPSPFDLRNEPIEEGVRKTFRLNLTETNLASIDGGSGQFQYFNSLGEGSCSNPQVWLPEIKINPVVFFADWNVDQNDNCSSATSVPNRPSAGRPPDVAGRNNFPSAFRSQNMAAFQNWYNGTQDLHPFWEGEPNDPPNQPGLHSSVGFEKNPWCMVYTGVTATTVVRKPFDPTGSGITLQARGYAKPFGGRVGPWYGKTWPQGAPNSQANSRDQMVDPLLPSRETAGASGSFDPFDDVANHSRFPGDENGVGSFQALSAMIEPFMQSMSHFNKSQPSPIALANFDHLGGRPNLEETGDSLAREATTAGGTVVPPKQRRFEIAAVAPDIFDALYYSIEPEYFRNYFSANTTNNGAQFQDNEKIYDFGSSKDGELPDSPPQVSVINQLKVARSSEGANPPAYMGDYPPIIRNWHHLLTSWHQEGAVSYGLDPQRFGRCETEVPDPAFPNPSNCLQGGRTGYSVKNVSRDFLLSADHELGGGSGAAGPLLNKPPF